MGKELSEMTLEELWELFPIILKEHNADYKTWYLEEEKILIEKLGSKIIKRISHIGSSAVEGLISKPTVDILLEIDKSAKIEKVHESLKQLGWGLMNSQDKPYLKYVYNKGYTKNGFEDKVFHLHVKHLGDWDELYFRDYLLEFDEVASEYGKLKLSLIEKYRNNRDGYTEAKTDFVKTNTKEARKYFGSKYK